jgi:hypothetical protein
LGRPQDLGKSPVSIADRAKLVVGDAHRDVAQRLADLAREQDPPPDAPLREADFECTARSRWSVEIGGNPDAICSQQALPLVTHIHRRQ